MDKVINYVKEDTLISFETAKLAKEKGFYQFTNIRKVFDNGRLKRKPPMGTGTWSDFGNRYFPAPTQSLLQKWLREVHKIHLTPTSISQESWQCHITRIGDTLGTNYIEDAYTYEEALEEGLIEALESITLIK